AVRIVRRWSGLDEAAARKLIEKAGGRAKVALVMHHAGVSPARARDLLVEHRGSLRAIVGDLPAADAAPAKDAWGSAGATIPWRAGRRCARAPRAWWWACSRAPAPTAATPSCARSPAPARPRSWPCAPS